MKIVIETSDEGLVQGLAVALLVHKRKPCNIKIKLEYSDVESELAEPLIRASLVGGAEDNSTLLQGEQLALYE
jgi:hypothetical protein